MNNNPLEYWTTYDAPAYKQLMMDIEGLLDAPGDRDVPLRAVFPAWAMAELCAAMSAVGWDGVDEVFTLWDADLAARPFVSGFLKDKLLGAKRFMSMPDRFTNTVNTVDVSTGEAGPTACRPSVINNYVGDLSSFESWFAAWKAFMFEQPVTVVGKGGVPKPTVPYQMIGKIPRAKYPELSEDEERLSMPMQILCLALFDATLVHVMNSLSPSGEWLTIKRRLCDALFVNKQVCELGLATVVRASNARMLLGKGSKARALVQPVVQASESRNIQKIFESCFRCRGLGDDCVWPRC